MPTYLLCILRRTYEEQKINKNKKIKKNKLKKNNNNNNNNCLEFQC